MYLLQNAWNPWLSIKLTAFTLTALCRRQKPPHTEQAVVLLRHDPSLPSHHILTTWSQCCWDLKQHLCGGECMFLPDHNTWQAMSLLTLAVLSEDTACVKFKTLMSPGLLQITLKPYMIACTLFVYLSVHVCMCVCRFSLFVCACLLSNL